MQSTVEKGDRFESEVVALLRLMPGVHLRQRQRVRGKSVDIVLETKSKFGSPAQVIAVECKDYSRRLSRVQVVSITRDYEALLREQAIDALYVVTRNGIVDSAAEVFNDRSVQHFTSTDLLNELLDVSPLINSMRLQFEQEKLNDYFQTAYCEPLDVDLVSKHYDSYYSSFIAWAAQESKLRPRPMDLNRALLDWEDACKTMAERAPYSRNNGLSKAGTDGLKQATYRRLIAAHLNHRSTGGLEAVSQKEILDEVVDLWIELAGSPQLAILGSYGTGKSTYCRYTAWRLASAHERGLQSRVPFLIELRHLTSSQDVEALVTHELADRHGVEGANFARFQSLNMAGYFLIILDGFDEMREGLSREALAHNWNQLNRLSEGNAKVLLAGRPTAFEDGAEKAALLHGGDSYLENRVRYMSASLVPLHTSRILPLISSYAKAKGLGDVLQARIDEIAEELRDGGNLTELLSRPVHVPMFLRVLPELGSLSSLRRSELYKLFIEGTIHREMSKGTHSGQTFDTQQRANFAARLAFEMTRIGDSRSIKVSAINDDVFDSFRTDGRSLDSVRRDLISACFLDFRPPDLLTFGHKSYSEYLTARYLLSCLDQPGGTDRFDIRFSREVLTFCLESMDLTHFRKIAKGLAVNIALASGLVAARTSVLDGYENSASAFDLLYEAIASADWETLLSDPNVSSGHLSRLVSLCEALPSELPVGKSMIDSLLAVYRRADDWIAVHALRALPPDKRPSLARLSADLGEERFAIWVERKYIDDRIITP